jgi:cytochrome oxidase Cu insertion factor (SCO1/SenC/PrrC family)
MKAGAGRIWLIAGGAAVLTAVAAVFLIPPAERKTERAIEIEPDPTLDEELPVLADPPAFELRDQNGAPFTRVDLVGHVTVAGFVFTRCQSSCPAITLRMRGIQDQTASIGDRVQLLSFSVDPDHDTPAVLAEYARKAGADPHRWRFLTGRPDEVRRVINAALKLTMERDGTTQPNGAPAVIHSDHLALFDRQGRVRGYYSSTDPDRLAHLHDDLTRLLSE